MRVASAAQALLIGNRGASQQVVMWLLGHGELLFSEDAGEDDDESITTSR